MGVPSQALPTIGQPNSTEDAKVRSALSELQTILTGNVDAANITNATITDAKLTSPTSSVWRPFMTSATGLTALTAGPIYAFYRAQASQGATPSASGPAQELWMPVVADHAVTGLTTRLRLRVTIGVNNIAPTSTIVVGLHPMSPTGNTSVALTPATAVTSVSFVAPAANSVAATSSASFDLTTLSTSSIYGFAVTLTAASMAVNSYVFVSASIDMRHT